MNIFVLYHQKKKLESLSHYQILYKYKTKLWQKFFSRQIIKTKNVSNKLNFFMILQAKSN